jgi:TRAP-type C4-dicarboxylate transport system permease small subunit
MGGAVSYSRGHFIAITFLADRAPASWREFIAAGVEWVVIFISALIGYFSVPLLLANMEERTLLLEISYAWLTLPMTIGSALFVAHAGFSL